jgi:hypothetical protein
MPRISPDQPMLGPRPGWWRPLKRQDWDLAERRLRRMYDSDLRFMLSTAPENRPILALLIGWDPNVVDQDLS